VVENPRVFVVRVHAARTHTHRDPPPKTLFLVAGASEAALERNLSRELREVAEVLLDHQYTCRTDSRFVRTIALSGSSSNARSQHRIASSRSCRRSRMFPSLR